MISLDRKYEILFRQMRKRVEVRTRVPNDLKRGDWLLCCRVASGGFVTLALRVAAIERVMTDQWPSFSYGATGLSPDELYKYVGNHVFFYGIHVDRFVEFGLSYRLEDFGLHSSPQWFSCVRRLPFPEFINYLNEDL